MPTLGQNARLFVGSAVSGSAVAVSAATVADPVVLTTATNTFAAGDIGVVPDLSFVGPDGLNDRAFVLDPVTTTSATLKGEDGSINGAYVSGGSLQKWTMIEIGEVTKMSGFDGSAAKIDITTLRSKSKRYQVGLQDFGSLAIGLLQTPPDAGQSRLWSAKAQQLRIPFSIQFVDGTVTAFLASVMLFSFDGVQPEGVVTNSVSLLIGNAPSKPT
jgi:hypothetical protein